MTKFRFVTPHRIGKWYTDLGLAQRFASVIGAGFFDRRSGRFVAYRDTRLETAVVPPIGATRSAGSPPAAP